MVANLPSMLDWCDLFEQAAAQQGWCITEVAPRNSPCALEINHVEDAVLLSTSLGTSVPQLKNDREAVQAFQAAWLAQQPHAVLAYQIIRSNSPSEFDHWHMQEWCVPTLI
jgi:hypothetical protein